jgi:hypothetical protein
MDGLFSATRWPNPSALKTIPNPFFTSYFVPVPSPVPPPPTTRKVEVTYQGFYQAGDSVKHAIVKVGERFVAAVPGAPVTTNEIFVAAVPGAPVTTNLFIADMSLSSLVLTNPPGATNVIPLSIKKEIEVPIQ